MSWCSRICYDDAVDNTLCHGDAGDEEKDGTPKNKEDYDGIQHANGSLRQKYMWMF